MTKFGEKSVSGEPNESGKNIRLIASRENVKQQNTRKNREEDRKTEDIQKTA